MFTVTPQDSSICDLVQGSLSVKNRRWHRSVFAWKSGNWQLEKLWEQIDAMVCSEQIPGSIKARPRKPWLVALVILYVLLSTVNRPKTILLGPMQSIHLIHHNIHRVCQIHPDCDQTHVVTANVPERPCCCDWKGWMHFNSYQLWLNRVQTVHVVSFLSWQPTFAQWAIMLISDELQCRLYLSLSPFTSSFSLDPAQHKWLFRGSSCRLKLGQSTYR